MKLEAKIGLFIILGVIALFILSTQVTNFSKFGDDGYEISSYIDDATGLEIDSKVLMNGVNIGSVSKVFIEGRRVKIVLRINQGVKIAVDSTLYIMQESVLGAKSINLVSGTSLIDLQPSGEITKFHNYAAFDKTSDTVNDAAEEIKLLMKDVRSVLGEEQKEQLKEIIKVFRDVGLHLDALITENRSELKATVESVHKLSESFSLTADTLNSDLPSIMKRINSMTVRLDHLSSALDDKVPTAVDKFVNIEDNISAILAENRDSIKTTISSANSFFDSADEAFIKVDDMLSSFTQSELEVGINMNYMLSDQNIKSYGGVAYYPNPETVYLLDIISMTDYSMVDINGTYVESKKHDKSKLLISAQYAKRYDNLLVRGGIIELTGGLGVDYYAFNDKLKFGFELYDFNAVNDLRSNNPHATFAMRYKFLKHIELHAGYDNMFNSRSQNIYFGLGVRFIDNNLKYILSSASMAAK